MAQIKTLIINKPIINFLTPFIVLLGVSVFAPFFHFQPISGPLVNACLFIGATLLDVQAGIMLGLLPSLIALSVGTLPAPLAPMIPFIMVSNALLVLTFSWVQNNIKHISFGFKFAIGVLTASVLKYLFLFSSSYIVIHLIAQKPIAQKAAQMMSWPQLITAVCGGALAYGVLKLCAKKLLFSTQKNVH